MGAPFEAIDAHDYVINVAVSADGSVAVAYGYQIFNGTEPTRGPGVSTSRPGARSARASSCPTTRTSGTSEFNVAVNADGTQIAVGGGSFGKVRVFDLRSGELLTTIEPPADMLSSIQGTRHVERELGAGRNALRGFVGNAPAPVRSGDVRVDARHHRARNRHRRIDAVQSRWCVRGRRWHHPNEQWRTRGGRTHRSRRGDDRVDDRSRRVRQSHACDVFTFSVPEDRLWCADFSGVIRGRSLSTGELDGTTVEHQRSGLTSMAVQSVAGHRYLVSFGMQSPSIGRWQIDGGGPLTRASRRRLRRRRVQPERAMAAGSRRSDEANRIVRCRLGHGRSIAKSSPSPTTWPTWNGSTVTGSSSSPRMDTHASSTFRQVQTRDSAIEVEPRWSRIARPARADRLRLRRHSHRRVRLRRGTRTS